MSTRVKLTQDELDKAKRLVIDNTEPFDQDDLDMMINQEVDYLESLKNEDIYKFEEFFNEYYNN